jgi:acetyl esterase/lipase
MRLARGFVRWFRSNTNLEQVRRERAGRDYPAPAPVTRRLRRVATIERDHVDERPVFRVRPQKACTDWHLIYTHGGGYIHALQQAHWGIIDATVRATNCEITVPIYPLTPEHTYRDAYSFLRSVYRDVLSQHSTERICLIGDSAGGGLAVGQALNYRDTDLRMPDAIVLFSPWLDVTLSHPDVPDIEARDPMLGANWLREVGRWWAGDDDPETPLVSPLFGDFTGLPDIQIHIGTHDLLWPDTRRLKQRADTRNIYVDLREYEGAFHDFMAATFTPEAHRTYQRVADFLDLQPT